MPVQENAIRFTMAACHQLVRGTEILSKLFRFGVILASITDKIRPCKDVFQAQ
jgi:hypothetical protein